MAGNTFTWFGGSGSGDVPGNWTPSGGPPGPGDTGIENAGTLQVTDGQFTDNTLLENAGTLRFSNDTGTIGKSSFDANTSLIAGASGNAEFDVFGGFLNDGTIEAVGHTLTVAISAFSDGGPTFAGTLLNDGLISVQDGATLDVTGGASASFQGGAVDIKHSTAVIAAADSNSTYTLDNTSTLALHSAGTNVSVNFSGTADLLAMNSTALDSTIDISGFSSGDTLDIGPETVGTIVYQAFGGSEFGGSGSPVLTILNNAGGTVLSDPFTNARGGSIGGSSGTFIATVLPSGFTAIGPFELATAGNGDTLLEALPPSTWAYTGADPGNLDDPLNFSLISGPGNTSEFSSNGTIYGGPNSGDTVIGNNATLAFPLNNTINGNTILVSGTSEISFLGTEAVGNNGTSGGKSGISYQNPTIDETSLISNDPAPPADTTLNFAGYNVNEGTLISDAGAGSSLTINVTPGTGTPGYLINYGDIEADTGNTVTIAVSGTSELFNANLIYANGGTVLIEGSSAGVVGGYAPEFGGAALIGDGGTIEVNAGFPSGTGGSAPTYAFYDGDAGDTLKVDQLAQFTGRIIGFQQGDTIDLGSGLAIKKIAVISDGRVLLENNDGGVLATLVLSSGAYNTGTFAVTQVAAGTLVAGGFMLTTGGDGDTLLTTNVVESVWNNASGTWQTAADWSTGVAPGPTASAVIGINATGGADGTTSPFVVTTGSTPVDVNSLIEINPAATLQITSATTVGTSSNENGIQQVAGDIEVTGGNTLTATFLKQDSPAADLQVDAGAVLAITGHDNLAFVNDGTISTTTVVNGTAFANGNTVGLFVTGTATVDGGTIDSGPVLNGTSVVSTGGLIDIGLDGGGTPSAMTAESGATVIDTYADLSSNPTSFGVLTLTGAGTTWDDAGDPNDLLNTRGEMYVGDDNESSDQPSPAPAGTAQLVVEDDATLNEASHAEIGNTADSAGSATIASGGVWNIGTASGGGFLNVGNAGSGTLDIDGGTVNVLAGSTLAAGGFGAAGTYISNGVTETSAAGMSIAHQLGSSGTITVEGGGALNVTIFPTITSSGFGVGQFGQGELEIYDGGTVSLSGGGMSVGSDTPVADGTVVVGGTFDASGTVVSSGGPSSHLIISGDTLTGLNGGMSVGKVGTGTLYVESGGTLQLDDGGFTVGSTAGSYGTVQVNGGLIENTNNGITVGNAGTGTLDIVNSGTVLLIGGGIDVGTSAGAQGLLEIASGGMLTSTTNGMEIGVNTGATGTLEVMAGGIYNVNTHAISAGFGAGATGTILVDGSGALINFGSQANGFGFDIGNAGTGYLTVESDGTVADAGVSINLGLNAGSTGTVAVTSGGRITMTGDNGIVVGSGGSGLLTIASTGFVSAANYFDIAAVGTASSGTVVVNGGTLTDNGIFGVGISGAATLVVEGGGLVDQTGVTFNIGAGIGSTGTVVVNGGTLDAQGNFAVGGAGSGTLTIDAASVVNDGTGGITIGNQAGGIGTAAVNGGILLGGGLQVGGFGLGTLSVTNAGRVVLNGGTNSGLGIGSAIGGTGSGVVTINSGTVAETGSGVTVGGTNESGSLQIGTLGMLITTGTTAIVGGVTIFPEVGEINASGTGNAAVTVNGGTWIANGALGVGGSGSGVLNVEGNGLVNAGTNTVSVGSGPGGAGTVTVGPGALLVGSLQVADPFSGIASGIVTVATGGTVDTGALTEGTGGAINVSGSLAVTGSFGISLGQSGLGPSLLTVDSGGTLSDAGFLTVGSSGAGDLVVQTGGVVTLTGGNSTVLGFSSGGAGVVTVEGVFNAGSGFFSVGNVSGSSDALTVEGGGTLTGAGISVANEGDGNVTVTGAGSRLAAAGEMAVGVGGAGSLLVQNDATVVTGTSALLTGFDVGSQSSGSGAAAVSGAGSLLKNTGGMVIGDAGVGSLSIQSGATVTTALGTILAPAAATIANAASAGGSVVNVTGPNSTWQISGALDIGNASTGLLAITNGATVSATTLDAGVATTGAGIITVSGPDADLLTTGTVTIGDAGSGELSILDGANANIGGDLDIANAGTGTGNVDLEDTTGTITLGGNVWVGYNGFGVFNVGYNVDYIQNDGGINFGPDSSGAINSFADPSPFLSNASPNPIAIGAQGVDQLAAYLFNSGEFTIPNGHALTFETPIIYGGGAFALGSGDSLVLNAGTVSGQTFTLGANDTLTIGIDNLATIDIPPSGTSGFTAEANPDQGALLVGNFGGVIADFTAGDTIEVDTHLASASGGTLSQNGSVVSVIEIANGATLGALTFDSAANATAAINDGAIALEVVPCFAAGTRIATARGEIAVEAIGVGEKVRVLLGGAGEETAGEGFSEVIWVGRREVDCARHAQPRNVWPVRVAVGAFGPGLPHSELWLSPDHAVYINDVLIPIKHLINGSTIVQVQVARVTYHHIELAQHDVLLAQGLPAESFLDMKDGTNYTNRAGPVRLYPDFSVRMWEAFGCARLVVTGPELAAARAMVAGFAAEQKTGNFATGQKAA